MDNSSLVVEIGRVSFKVSLDDKRQYILRNFFEFRG